MFSRKVQKQAADFYHYTSKEAVPTIDSQVSNHANPKFIEFNLLAKAENLLNNPTLPDHLPDPHKELAVCQLMDNKTIFGTSYDCKTDMFRKPSEVPGYRNCMDDRQLMSYMVNLQRWLQKHWRTQTLDLANPSKRQRCS